MLTARMLSLAVALVASLALLLAASEGASASTERPAGPAKVERQAKSALRIARRARKIGRRALARSQSALAAAQGAQADADRANGRLDAGQISSATAAGTVTTASETDYVDLGGPSVTVDVPASGLVEVWATVTFGVPNDGLVGLYEDGQPVSLDQGGICGSGTIDDALLSTTADTGDPLTLSTPSAILFTLGCGTPGSAPGSMLFESSPGRHTYELRYADCGCDPGDASFSQRTLRVAGSE